MTKKFLANDYIPVFESPFPSDVFCYSPGIALCPDGRLIATCDFGGPGVSKLDGVKAHRGADCSENQGKIAISDNGGESWRFICNFPMLHARPFVAGNSLYIIGHAGDLGIMKSTDWGETWAEPQWFTKDQNWHQAPCNVWYANGKVYLIMERYVNQAWGWHNLAPVVMAGRTCDDLTKKESWSFSNELTITDAVDQLNFKYLGVPFFVPGEQTPDNKSDPRGMAEPGWLEANIVQFLDSDHVWHDSKGNTFHLWMRAHTGSTNLACIAKATEKDDGTIRVSLEKSPGEIKMLYVPCPGGHMKFHILYDETTKLYWLLSSVATDSMTCPNKLPDDRFNLPNNERQRLGLYFSKNCIDWCFAGMVAMGETQKQARHYASMVIRGDDLCILSRSGNKQASSAHNGNLITFHKVENFRDLIY